MVLFEIFVSFFQIGLFSIGGGYAALPIIQNIIVNNRGWLTLAEFADLIVISEMTPGPIILNSATFVGTQVAGLPGAIIATIGCITAPTIIVSIIAYFYFKYKELPIIKTVLSMLRPAVVALIASAGLSIIILTFWGENSLWVDISSTNFTTVGIYIAALAVLKKFKPNPVFVMMGCGVLGGLIYSFL